MASDQTVYANKGEVLDALVWRTIGLGASAVQAVLNANPALAGFDTALPHGTPVLIPAAASTPAAAALIQLWD